MKLAIHADAWAGSVHEMAKKTLDKGQGWLKIVNSPDVAYGWAQAYPQKRIVYRKAEPADLANLSNWMEQWPDPAQCARVVADYNAIGSSANLYVEGINEPKIDSIQLAQWFGQHEAARSQILKQRGLTAVIGNFATGAITPLHFEEFLSSYVQAGGDRYALVGLHEYGLASMPPTSDTYNMLAHRRLVGGLGKTFLWVLTETGCDSINVDGQTVGGGWKTQGLTEEQYWAYMKTVADALDKDPYVLAAFVFTYNGTERWQAHELKDAATFNARLLEATVARTYTRGIDISSWQPLPDWKRVVDYGISYAYIRNADALSGDAKFAANWAGARGKVLRGAYQYFRYTSSGKAQADFFLSRIDPADLGELPPVVDVEQTAPDSAYYAAQLKIWVDIVEKAYGKKAVIYTRPDIWNRIKPYCPWADLNYLWIARYPYSGTVPSMTVLQSGALDPVDLAPFGRWHLWQYSSIGYVDGIGYPVDLDVFDGDLLALRRWAGLETPVPAPIVYTWQDFINATYAAAKALKYPADKIWDWLFVRAGISNDANTKRKLAYDGPAIDSLNWSAQEIKAYRAAGGQG